MADASEGDSGSLEAEVALRERLAAADKAVSDAEKVAADAAEVRAKTVRDDASAGATAAKDLRDEAEKRRTDTAAALKAAVPDLTKLSQPTLTFSGDRDLRQGELVALCVRRCRAEPRPAGREILR